MTNTSRQRRLKLGASIYPVGYHVSGGRAGWNLVTSAAEAESQNFNLDQHLAHADRYKRAREFVEVVTGLWDGWDDDAFLFDQQTGIYFEPSKLRLLNHHGKYFS